MQQVTTKKPQQVTTKNPKKVEAGKRLDAHNHRKRGELKVKREAQAQKSGVNQYYEIGAVLAVGVIGGLGYYIYRTKKGPASGEDNIVPHHQPPKQLPRPPRSRVPVGPQTNKFEM